MSLTQHLQGGVLGQWLSQHCPAVSDLAHQLADAVRGQQPVRPPTGLQREDLAAVGGAVDARLSLAVDASPPFGALLGAVRAGALAEADAGRYACTWPSHAAVPAEDAPAGLWLRSTPQGWAIYGDHPPEGETAAHPGFTRFLRSFRDTASAVPVGTAGTREQERLLAQQCLVIGDLEGYYRSGVLSPRARAVLEGRSVAVDQALIDDVVAIVRRVEPTLDQARQGAGGRAIGTAAPILLPQWAEGDVVLGRDGVGEPQTLVDVKTSMAGHRPDRVTAWLQQIVAYALLDARDIWQIRRVGLWLPRIGRIYSWPLETFTSSMTAPPAAFRELAAACYASDSGQPSTSAR